MIVLQYSNSDMNKVTSANIIDFIPLWFKNKDVKKMLYTKRFFISSFNAAANIACCF